MLECWDWTILRIESIILIENGQTVSKYIFRNHLCLLIITYTFIKYSSDNDVSIFNTDNRSIVDQGKIGTVIIISTNYNRHKK